MHSLGARWFFGVSCRCPGTADLASAVPNFLCLMFGPRTGQYGAVTLFVAETAVDAVLHLPALSTSQATCWAKVGESTYWGGFSIPPRKKGKTKRPGDQSSTGSSRNSTGCGTAHPSTEPAYTSPGTSTQGQISQKPSPGTSRPDALLTALRTMGPRAPPGVAWTSCGGHATEARRA